MTLPELFSAAFKHKDMPSDLKVDLRNFLNDRNHKQDCDGVEMMQVLLGATEADIAASGSKNIEIENTALLISGLLNNPNVPQRIRDGLSEGVEECFNEDIDQSEIIDYRDSPEYIAMILRGLPEND